MKSLAGKGRIETARVANRTNIVRAQASNPLKFLCPKRSPDTAWVYATTFGGGLVAGDEIDFDIHIAADTTCVITSQSSTKVYRSKNNQLARQTSTAVIEPGGLLVVAPDPLTCFAQSRYEQIQQFDVRPGGNLVFVDWITSGRRARGECWEFSSYFSQADISYDGTRVLLDATKLDPQDGPLDSPFRMGKFHCLALIAIVGERFQTQYDSISDEIQKQPIRNDADLIESSSIIQNGIVWRAVGTDTESIAYLIKQRLQFLSEPLGGELWDRKW